MANRTASKRLMGEMISEAVAMFIIIAFGDSAACMYTLYDPSPYKQAYWGVCISWGLAVTICHLCDRWGIWRTCQSGC